MDADLLKSFGSRLRQLRQGASLTQQELAERAGVHITYVARVEAGARNPSLNSLALLAHGLGVNLAQLVEGVGE